MRRAAVPLAACLLLVASAAHASGSVTLRYENPEGFADVGMAPAEPPRVRAGLLEEFRRYVERDLAGYVPEGARLEVTLTQLDMAGTYGPSSRGGLHVRTIADSTPPSIDLRFVLRGKDGAVLRDGERRLRNPNFMFGSSPSSAPLRHERDLLEAWAEREFSGLR